MKVPLLCTLWESLPGLGYDEHVHNKLVSFTGSGFWRTSHHVQAEMASSRGSASLTTKALVATARFRCSGHHHNFVGVMMSAGRVE